MINKEERIVVLRFKVLVGCGLPRTTVLGRIDTRIDKSIPYDSGIDSVSILENREFLASLLLPFLLVFRVVIE